jgi:hypothetical protein
VAVAGLAGVCLPFAVGTDWMPGWRFSVPYLPVLAAIVAIGWMRVLRPLTSRLEAAGPVMVLLLLAGAAVLHHDERRQLAEEIDLRARGYATGHVALADWIRDRGTRPGESVALMDIGVVGYRCPDRRILDITGLTNRHIGKRVAREGYDPAYVLGQAPELIVIVLTAPGDGRQPLPPDVQLATWTGIERGIVSHPEFQARYRRPRPAAGAESHWTEHLAARIGAERVFEHAHPGRYYLLAAFRRSG